MYVQTLDHARFHAATGRPLDAWPDDSESALPPDPVAGDDRARAWAECNSDLARHLASIPEPPDSPEQPPVTALEFAENALTDGPDAAASILAAVAPGPGSAVLVGMLDPARLTPASMVGVIAATEKLASWVQALQHRWLAAFTAPGVAATREGLLAYASAPGQPLHHSPQRATDSPMSAGAGGSTASIRAGVGGGGDTDLPFSGPTVHGDLDLDQVIDEAAFKVAAAEVSAALHFSPITAQRRVRQALDFAIDLPGTLQALSQGHIDRGRALTILDRTENLPAALRRKVESAVLPKATTRTPGQLRGIVDRAVISVDPAAAKKRQIKAREERHVTVRPNRDGMSTFIAEVAAEHAAVAFSVLDRVATTLHRRADEGRRIGALRADVFSDIFDQLATRGAVDLRATIGGRAVVTHDPMRYSWVSDTATIAGRFDSDTSLIDPHPGSQGSSPDSPILDTDVEAALVPRHADNPATPGARAANAAVRSNTDAADDATPGSELLAVGNAAPEASAHADDLPCGPFTSSAGEFLDGADSAHTEWASAEDIYRDACALGPHDSPAKLDSADLAPVIGDDLNREADPPRPTNSAREADAQVPTAITDDPCRDTVAPTSDNPNPNTVAPTSDYPNPNTAAPDPENRARDEQLIKRPFAFPTQQGRLTHLNVTIAATTLAGLDDLPGELDGYGPIPADLCRALAVSASSITAIGVDPTCGTALEVGRTTYRPRLSQRDHVTQRDRTCRFPGCRQPARRCQIDHSEEFCDGGPTCPCNLACLCKFHHDLKTTGLWDALQHPDASITWTSPTGRRYRTQTPEWPIAAPETPAAECISAPAETEGRGSGTTATPSSSAQTVTRQTPTAETAHEAPGHPVTDEPPF